jgi:ABC-type polysaccharide/polyol phosphate export permease
MSAPDHDAGAPTGALLVRVNEPVASSWLGVAAVRLHFGDIRRALPVLAALVSREVAARYRGSVLGYLWTQLNPLLLLLVYTVVFRVYLRIDMEHYAVYLLCGLLAWEWFGSTLGTAATSITQGGDLAKKALLPMQLLPTVKVLTNLVNFMFGLPVLAAALLLTGHWPSIHWLWVPVLVGLQLMLVQGLATAVSALTVRFRDVQFLIVNFLTFAFFLTPICYPLSLVPERFQPLVLFNPMGALVVSYQDVLFFGRCPRPAALLFVVAAGLITLFVGARIFEAMRTEVQEVL